MIIDCLALNLPHFERWVLNVFFSVAILWTTHDAELFVFNVWNQCWTSVTLMWTTWQELARHWSVILNIFKTFSHSLSILEHCDAQHMSLLNLINFPNNTIQQCDIPLSRETPEVDEIVLQAISHDPNNLMLAANSLYQLAQDKLVSYFIFSWVIA